LHQHVQLAGTAWQTTDTIRPVGLGTLPTIERFRAGGILLTGALVVSFLAYFVALIIAVGSVLFGLEVVIAPSPKHKPAVPVAGAPSALNKLAKREADHAERDIAANKVLTPVYPANPGGIRTVTALSPPTAETIGVALPPDKVTEEVPSASNKGTQSVFQAADVSAPPPKPTTAANATLVQSPAVQPAPPEHQVAQGLTQKTAGSCDIEACAGAYHSFRASDCSYQPFEGPRRTCVTPHAMQARKDIGSELRSRGMARTAKPRAARYEELRERDIDEDDTADAVMDDDRGRVIFYRGPSGWFR
jgi:hypothetical protein